jgi:hypothetical protein
VNTKIRFAVAKEKWMARYAVDSAIPAFAGMTMGWFQASPS